MAAAKSKPAKARKPKVPDEAVDGCEDGHIAGKGTNVKTSTQIYDDTGTMALCCRHDIPILVANIDTPGEQQKYTVALLLVFFGLIPTNATVMAFYDVGCVLERSLQTVSVHTTVQQQN
jgi:Kyakuja-Dileera-Zisupton transposase